MTAEAKIERIPIDARLEGFLIKLGIDQAADGYIDVPRPLIDKYVAITHLQDGHRDIADRVAKGVAIAYSDFTKNHETPVHIKAAPAQAATPPAAPQIEEIVAPLPAVATQEAAPVAPALPQIAETVAPQAAETTQATVPIEPPAPLSVSVGIDEAPALLVTARRVLYALIVIIALLIILTLSSLTAHAQHNGISLEVQQDGTQQRFFAAGVARLNCSTGLTCSWNAGTGKVDITASGSSGANVALSNLASVSINTHLLFQSGVDAGSTTKPVRNLFLYGGGTYGSTYVELTGAPTGNRVVTFPDSSTSIPIISQLLTFTGPTAPRTYTLPDTNSSLAPLVSPSFTTPTLGVATATSINKVTITAPATGAVLTIPDGVTLNAGAGGTLGTAAFTAASAYQAAGSYAASGANSDITSLSGVTGITGGASNMTITSGTGNSRTMILRTTTSGGTATTAVTIDASQRFGIGATPSYPLDVASDLGGSSPAFVARFSNTFSGSGPSSGIVIMSPNATSASDRNWGNNTNTSAHGSFDFLESASNTTLPSQIRVSLPSGGGLNMAAGSLGFGSNTAPDITLSRNTTGVAQLRGADAVTNAVTNTLILGHLTSGTAAAGYGAGLQFNLDSSTTAYQSAAQIAALWTTATHASRTADLVFYTVNNAAALAEAGRFTGAKDFNVIGGILTADPTSGVGPLWRWGSKKTGTLVLDTGNYLEVSVAGATYKIALIQ